MAFVSSTPELDLALLQATTSVMDKMTKLRSSFIETRNHSCDIVMEKGRVKNAQALMSFTVEANTLNAGGNLFGGYVSSQADTATARLMLTCNLRAERMFIPTMSVALNVEFHNGASHGEEVYMIVTVERVGKSIGFTCANFYRGHPSNGVLLYKAHHQVIISRGSAVMADRIRENDPDNNGKVEAALAAYEKLDASIVLPPQAHASL